MPDKTDKFKGQGWSRKKESGWLKAFSKPAPSKEAGNGSRKAVLPKR